MKPNCWEILECGRGPGGGNAGEVCPAVLDASADGVNGGTNGGRICWAIPDTLCFGHHQSSVISKRFLCQVCRVYRQVKKEEGPGFQPIKFPTFEGSESSRKQRAERLRRTVIGLTRLLTVCQDVMRHAEIQSVLRTIIEQACHACDAERGLVRLFEPAEERLVAASVAGHGVVGFAVPIADDAVAAYIAKNDTLVNILDTAKGPTYMHPPLHMERNFEQQYGFPVHNLLAVPVHGSHEADVGEQTEPPPAPDIIGVIELLNRRGADFTEYDEWFLTEVAVIASLALQNVRISRDLREIRRTDRAKSRFVALLMHQIISPLSTVYTCVSTLTKLADRISPDDSNALVQGALSKVLIVQELAKKLLDLAAIQSGRALADLKNVDMVGILREETKDREKEAADRDIRLIAELPAGACEVYADPTGLSLIFTNLLSNAIKYSDAGTEIVVRGRTEEGTFFASVCDQGPGISSEDLDHLFDEFFRCADATKREIPGSGLGLAFVRTLVARYGGSIHVDSQVGKGSTFTVSFPRT
ncbi:MAG: GAF domain-containing sensor histidine kinase [Planctomycetota bacterium]|jgi:signal transduction histidine kinase